MKFYSNAETAELLGITVRTLDTKRKQGLIAYCQSCPGGKILFSEDAITAYHARMTHRATPERASRRAR